MHHLPPLSNNTPMERTAGAALSSRDTVSATQQSRSATAAEAEAGAFGVMGMGIWDRLAEERNSLSRERLAFAEERASFTREREAMAGEREAEHRRLSERETRLRESEAALQSEWQALRAAHSKREHELEQREERLREREQAVAKTELDLQSLQLQLDQKEQRLAASGAAGPPSPPLIPPLARSFEKKTIPLGQTLLAGNEYSAHAHSDHVQKDVLEDVPKVVEEFSKSGGVVPLAVHVAEVEAMQQAVSKLRDMKHRYMNQIEQLSRREENARGLLSDGKMKYVKYDLDALKKGLQEYVDESKKVAETLQDRTAEERATGIERFVPMLLRTVEKYNLNFERLLMAPGGETALTRLSNLCADSCVVKGRELRQPLPSAMPGHDKSTLLHLLETALHASPELNRLAHGVIEGLPEVHVLAPSKPTKGIHRILQKTQEEYEGDYTRLLDYARASILCVSVTELITVLERLLGKGGAHSPKPDRWRVCRIKDRLSRQWDSEQSGGNRDILINGHLNLGGDRWFIVEVQLHLRDLFVLKGDLHTLYNGARVLGAMEDHTMQHEGLISNNVLSLASRGVLRKLGVAFSDLQPEQVETTASLLCREPCALLQLDMTSCHVRPNSRPGTGNARPVFEDKELREIVEPPTGRLACRRLRVLKLSNTGVKGALPSSLSQCSDMTELALKENELEGEIPEELLRMPSLAKLDLSRNALTGRIPDTFADCGALVELFLSYNKLCGAIPPSIATCHQLQIINLAGNKLIGEIPKVLGLLSQLQKLFLDQNDLTGGIPVELGECRLLENVGLQRNRLAGTVPASFGHLTKLQKLVLGPNMGLCGMLPSEMGKLRTLNELVLDDTALEVPEEMEGCVKLKKFSFKGREDTIPAKVKQRIASNVPIQ